MLAPDALDHVIDCYADVRDSLLLALLAACASAGIYLADAPCAPDTVYRMDRAGTPHIYCARCGATARLHDTRLIRVGHVARLWLTEYRPAASYTLARRAMRPMTRTIRACPACADEFDRACASDRNAYLED